MMGTICSKILFQTSVLSFQTYVTGNNLYYQPSEGAVQVTDDGDLVARFNGIPDWLYEGTTSFWLRANV